MDLLEFARGPALWVSLAIGVLGVGWRLWGIFRQPVKPDWSEPRSSATTAGALRMIVRRMWHHETFRQRTFLSSFNAYAYHIGLAIVFFGFVPHIAFVKRLTGLSWPAVPGWLFIAAVGVVFVGLGWVLVARLTDPVLKLLSNFDDYFSWVVTILPMITGMAVITLSPDQPIPRSRSIPCRSRSTCSRSNCCSCGCRSASFRTRSSSSSRAATPAPLSRARGPSCERRARGSPSRSPRCATTSRASARRRAARGGDAGIRERHEARRRRVHGVVHPLRALRRGLPLLRAERRPAVHADLEARAVQAGLQARGRAVRLALSRIQPEARGDGRRAARVAGAALRLVHDVRSLHARLPDGHRHRRLVARRVTACSPPGWCRTSCRRWPSAPRAKAARSARRRRC